MTEILWDPQVGEPEKGWRVWTVAEKHDEMVVKSITYPVAWPKRKPMRAHCMIQWRRTRAMIPHGNADPHQAPISAGGPCSCGIYSLRQLHLCRKWSGLNVLGLKAPALARVLGEIAMWGRISQHQEGFRAEYAYPLSFTVYWVHPELDPDSLMDSLCDGYGVPVNLDTQVL